MHRYLRTFGRFVREPLSSGRIGDRRRAWWCVALKNATLGERWLAFRRRRASPPARSAWRARWHAGIGGDVTCASATRKRPVSQSGRPAAPGSARASAKSDEIACMCMRLCSRRAVGSIGLVCVSRAGGRSVQSSAELRGRRTRAASSETRPRRRYMCASGAAGDGGARSPATRPQPRPPPHAHARSWRPTGRHHTHGRYEHHQTPQPGDVASAAYCYARTYALHACGACAPSPLRPPTSRHSCPPPCACVFVCVRASLSWRARDVTARAHPAAPQLFWYLRVNSACPLSCFVRRQRCGRRTCRTSTPCPFVSSRDASLRNVHVHTSYTLQRPFNWDARNREWLAEMGRRGGAARGRWPGCGSAPRAPMPNTRTQQPFVKRVRAALTPFLLRSATPMFLIHPSPFDSFPSRPIRAGDSRVLSNFSRIRHLAIHYFTLGRECGRFDPIAALLLVS